MIYSSVGEGEGGGGNLCEYRHVCKCGRDIESFGRKHTLRVLLDPCPYLGPWLHAAMKPFAASFLSHSSPFLLSSIFSVCVCSMDRLLHIQEFIDWSLVLALSTLQP